MTTSSTIRQRSPASSSGPSMRRCRPCCLPSLRTKNALTSAPPASAAQATGSAPIVRPPTAVAFHARAFSATSSPSARKPGGRRTRAWRRRSTPRCARWSADLADDEGMGPQLVHQPVFRAHRPRTLSGVLARPIRIAAIARVRVRRARAGACSRSTRRAARRTSPSPGSRATRPPSAIPRPTRSARARRRTQARASSSTTSTTCCCRRSPASPTPRTPSGCGASIPALLALLVYGFGGGFLARFAAGRP